MNYISLFFLLSLWCIWIWNQIMQINGFSQSVTFVLWSRPAFFFASKINDVSNQAQTKYMFFFQPETNDLRMNL